MSSDQELQFKWGDAASTAAHGYLLPAVIKTLAALPLRGKDRRVFDVGCGNGSTAAALAAAGWKVTGIDPSRQGIRQARAAYPGLALHLGSAYDNLASSYGFFPVCVSLEVVEHLNDPRLYAKNLFKLLKPGGTLVLSTPYHGYFKNLAISLFGGWDTHFTALWDGGHIKFWSIKTLSTLLADAGFGELSFQRVGRVPVLAKSMIVVAKRP